MKGYYHIFSNGADAADFIIDKRDRILAMNRIARCVHRSEVEMIVFSIEDTHVHFIVFGEQEKVLEFKRLYEDLTRRRISRRENRCDAAFSLEIYQINDRSYYQNVAAYVAIQATKDHQPIMFYDNPWSSAPLYFRSGKVTPVWYFDDDDLIRSPVRFGDLSARNRLRILGGVEDLPDNWLVCNDIVLPLNYVAVRKFEEIFKTHNAYRVFCASRADKNDAINGKMADIRGVALSEEECRGICGNICEEVFGFRDLRRLDTRQRIRLAQEVRKRYKIAIPQIARRVHLPESELRKYLG